jgi:uncharacterized protein YndB with AHSA1/START domain
MRKETTMETEQATERSTKMNTDRIEKTVTLRAPRSRVWRAISNADEFGQWFGVTLDGAFAEGASVVGKIKDPRYAHFQMELLIERIQPESLFSYRWHPHAMDSTADYSSEPTTLVEFRLDDAEEGTLLTIVESGFDRLPLARRAEAFRSNDGGWTGQIKNIARYVASE